MVGAQNLFPAGRILGSTAGVVDEGTSAGAAAATFVPFLVYPCRMVLLLPQWRHLRVGIVLSSIMLLSVLNNTSGTATQ